MVVGNPVNTCKEIERAIESALNVILVGESGVGKDYLARSIHERRDWGGEFVVYDCERTVRDQTRIVEQLTSPLFFRRLQRSPQKDTLFIRRIDLLQGHLLARLSDFFGEPGKRGAFPRNKLLSSGIIGSLETSRHEKPHINIRLHRFLNSLFCAKIAVLPLRERKEEIPILIERFLSLFNREQNTNVLGITTDALELLIRYNWPDNICELRMEIERAATLTKNNGLVKPAVLSKNLIDSVSKLDLLP